MNVIEIIMLLIVIAMAVDGVRIGFVNTVFSVIRMIIGVVVAYFVCFALNNNVPEVFKRVVPVVFLIIVGIVLATLGAIERLLNIVDKIPVARLFNRVAGFVAGFLKGIILIWIIFYTASYFIDTSWGTQLYHMINDSELLKFVNSYNPIFYGFDIFKNKNGIVFA